MYTKVFIQLEILTVTLNLISIVTNINTETTKSCVNLFLGLSMLVGMKVTLGLAILRLITRGRSPTSTVATSKRSRSISKIRSLSVLSLEVPFVAIINRAYVGLMRYLLLRLSIGFRT